MESDKHESGVKLKQIIENLVREKEELAQRLIKANNIKLKEKAVAGGAEEFEEKEEEEDLTQIYIWGCGNIHSSMPIDRLLSKEARNGAFTQTMLDRKVYSTSYILKHCGNIFSD